MEDIYNALVLRNRYETLPFLLVHESNGTLLNQIDNLQYQCEALEQELDSVVQKKKSGGGDGSNGGGGDAATASKDDDHHDGARSAYVRNETKLREKLEYYQEELNSKLQELTDQKDETLSVQKELGAAKDLNKAQENTIESLRIQESQQTKSISFLKEKMNDYSSRTKLAEQQYNGLKETIRQLQAENDKLGKENTVLQERVLSEKDKLLHEMNQLTDIIEQQKKEIEMLRNYQKHEQIRNDHNNRNTTTTSAAATTANNSTTSTGGWFGFLQDSIDPTTSNNRRKQLQQQQQKQQQEKEKGKKQQEEKEEAQKESGGRTAAAATDDGDDDNNMRRFGSSPDSVVVPTEPKHRIQATHMQKEGFCLRYDNTNNDDLLITSGADSYVKVWNVANGTLRSTLHGTTGHIVMGCDISCGIAAGAGTDKTCRVWNLKTNRMIHHLVGHGHKITCVRLYNDAKQVLTGSADRSLKVWDISRTTYRQTVTLRHSSICNCIDIDSSSGGSLSNNNNNNTAMSGHVDGGLRLWDLRTGERTMDIPRIHDSGHGGGGITSAQFHPYNSHMVLTNGTDSCVKVIDLRNNNSILHTLRHPEFQTTYNWSSCSFSPDGKYAGAGSNSTGNIFIWNLFGGSLVKKLSTENNITTVSSSSNNNSISSIPVPGFAWSRGGSTGQQVATLNQKGELILWA